MHTTLERRFWNKVEKTDGCWLWTAGISREGYGRIQRGGRGEGVAFAHRVSWELHHGAIPENMTINHICLVRHCVNPAHLQLLTRAENGARAWVTSSPADRHYEKGDDEQPCVHGHLDWYRGKRGRVCRVCRREGMRKRRASVLR